MTRAKLLERLAQDMGVPKNVAEVGLNSMVNAIHETLARGDKVNLGGLGVFRIERREARQGRNPKTMEVIDIPPRKVIKFRPTISLKEALEKLS